MQQQLFTAKLSNRSTFLISYAKSNTIAKTIIQYPSITKIFLLCGIINISFVNVSAQWTNPTSGTTVTPAKVGIGISNPTMKLEIGGKLSIGASFGDRPVSDINSNYSIQFSSLGAAGPTSTFLHPAGRIYADNKSGGWAGQVLKLESSPDWNKYHENQLVLKGDGSILMGGLFERRYRSVNPQGQPIGLEHLNNNHSLIFGSVGALPNDPLAHTAGRIYGDNVGGGWAGQMLKLEAASNDWNAYNNNQFVLRSNGNIGIGTNAPASKLHLIGTHSNASNYAQLMVEGSGANGHGMIAIKSASSNEVSSMNFLNGSNNRLWSISSRWNFGGGNNRLSFLYNDGGWINNGAGWKEPFVIQENGNIGIGTNAPGEQLTLAGRTDPRIMFVSTRNTNQAAIWSFDGTNLKLMQARTNGSNGEDILRIRIQNPDEPNDIKMGLKGVFYAKEVEINANGDWADYVFQKEYKLRPLEEVKSFIEKNQHLPGVPSAAYIKENGLAVGNMHKIHMEKIEELTLYILQLNNEIKTLKTQLSCQSK